MEEIRREEEEVITRHARLLDIVARRAPDGEARYSANLYVEAAGNVTVTLTKEEHDAIAQKGPRLVLSLAWES
jgi:hypothetical protein